MGMSSKDMECSTYFDVMCKVRGFRKNAAMTEHWHRIGAFTAAAPHMGKKAKTMTLEKFWPIPELDDRQKKVQKLTPERQARLGETIKEMMAGNGKTRNDN